MSTSSNPGVGDTEHLVQASPDATVELSETELAQVSGGDKTKTTSTTAKDKPLEYLKVTMQEVFIT
jgi:bacteriocin-like protein